MSVHHINAPLYTETKLELFLSLAVVAATMCEIQYQLYLYTINPLSATHHFGSTCDVATNVNF